MASNERIVVPVDGSEPSMRALDVAGRIAKGLGASLEVVSVLDLTQVDVYDSFYLTDTQLEELQEKIKNEILENARERAPEGVNVEAKLLKGRAEKMLDEEVEREGVVMVVIGRTGKGAFERLVQGSVSRHMAAHCPVPVTVVP
jgi:nucleotide-binding universal stress UspA family protein